MAAEQRAFEQDPFATIPVGPLGIIPMRGCEDLAQKVNYYLCTWRESRELSGDALYTFPGVEHDNFLLEADCPRFGNGEGKGIIRESVRGYDLYLMTDVCNYSCTYKMYGMEVPMSPDDHFQDLKRIISAVESKARRVSVIMPVLYSGRQHKRSSRESLDCANALQELERMGVSNIITFDAHDPRVQNAVPLSSFDNVMPSYQMLKALFREVKDIKVHKDSMMIISPDEGALQRNIYYATVLGLNAGMFYKRRDYSTIVNGRNPIVAHEYLGDDVAGKDIFVADDLISTGDSVLDIARELKARKANRVFVAATYGFFTEGLDAFNKAYEEGLIDRVLTTNLTYRTPELKAAPWYVEVDMAKYIAYLIASLNYDHSISKLLNPLSRINLLLERYRREQTESGLIY